MGFPGRAVETFRDSRIRAASPEKLDAEAWGGGCYMQGDTGTRCVHQDYIGLC